jgi:hypothetical protein
VTGTGRIPYAALMVALHLLHLARDACEKDPTAMAALSARIRHPAPVKDAAPTWQALLNSPSSLKRASSQVSIGCHSLRIFSTRDQ